MQKAAEMKKKRKEKQMAQSAQPQHWSGGSCGREAEHALFS
jgi:hypothetical protein